MPAPKIVFVNNPKKDNEIVELRAEIRRLKRELFLAKLPRKVSWNGTI